MVHVGNWLGLSTNKFQYLSNHGSLSYNLYRISYVNGPKMNIGLIVLAREGMGDDLSILYD